MAASTCSPACRWRWRCGRPASGHLASLSFSELELLDRQVWVDEHVAAIRPDTLSPDWYFPEAHLARWLAGRDLPSTVYAFPPLGVQPLREAYRHLVDRLDLDAIVLVDGGTDILLRGDESGLGTPVEDITSLAAVAGLDVPVRLVSSLGFGIDAHDGVNHVEVLENLAALDREGGYLGALSIPGSSREAVLYREAVAQAQAATRTGRASSRGRSPPPPAAFRDVRFSRRTGHGDLFVNPSWRSTSPSTCPGSPPAASTSTGSRTRSGGVRSSPASRRSATSCGPPVPRAYPH
ncbi:DUF1152 domain-containing protein [Micromonospora sp. BRA006-A]|nr:DUF1152 domain-containing protein [Micromonospora sp. BRA006-A]